MHPLQYLSGSGAQTAAVVSLMWFMLVVSVVVCTVITILVIWAVLSRRARVGPHDLRSVSLDSREGLKWVWTGLLVSAVPLFATVFWTVAVLADTGRPPSKIPLTIDVTAKRWWWDATYEANSKSGQFHVANELHIPVGIPVLLHLKSADVIHSFWVPRLAGKTDVIPGQTNAMWIQANAPGEYRGQCGEFCGAQHAHMGFFVIADPPGAFDRWRNSQVQTASAAAAGEPAVGQRLFQQRCSRCHTVRGTPAHGSFGPDLTHLMSRSTIGAGLFKNNPAALSGWVENAQNVKSGALMPNQHLSGPELSALRIYLETLR